MGAAGALLFGSAPRRATALGVGGALAGCALMLEQFPSLLTAALLQDKIITTLHHESCIQDSK